MVQCNDLIPSLWKVNEEIIGARKFFRSNLELPNLASPDLNEIRFIKV